MKKIFLLLILIIFLYGPYFIFAQVLTFKVDNPRIIKKNNKQWFQFDVLIKASDTGTYLYSTQLAFDVANPNNFVTTPSNNIYVDLSQGILGLYFNGMPEYTYVRNWGSPTNSFGVAITTNFATSGADPIDVCAKITTSFQKIVTIGTEISSSASGVTGTAGIKFSPSNMPAGLGQVQHYALPGILLPTHFPYLAPNMFEGFDFNYVYLSRVFSNAWGWSQYGGTSNNVQYINWADVINTSVWDSVGIINTNGALMNKLRIHTGARLKIMSGNSLSCMDSVEINEPNGLWISSDYYGTGSFIDNGIITYKNGGSVGVERYLKQNQWHLYCIPVDTTATRPFISKQLGMKWYDEPNHVYRSIVNPGMDSLLTRDMLGYFVYSNSTLTSNPVVKVTGSLHTGPIMLPMGNHVGPKGPDGWNLIGNPYPSAIDWLSLNFALSQVDPTIYVFHPETGNYYFWNRHDQLHSTNASSIIAAQQGFYMHATVPGSQNGSIYIDNSVRLHSAQPFYKPDTLLTNYLFITASGNGLKDETQIRFDSTTTSLFDPDHDAYKLTGLDEAPQLYSILQDSTEVSLNTLPYGGANLIIPLGFHTGVAGTDTLEASNLESFPPGSQIWLRDLKTDIYQYLPDQPRYIFSSVPTDDPLRFRLYFYYPWVGINNHSFRNILIYSFDDYLFVKNLNKGPTNGTVRVYDLLGREVFEALLKDMDLNKFLPGVNSGYYLVRVVTDDNSYSQKVYLK
ncbi:MAG: T9SS type A sorting domain-containing protein [Bacteroidetes bacterium]|nr:T9SS type A sorting domain-containing protein [Bacteroidota bacterium]